jgi:uncharacterized protein (DUF885 family)
VRFFVVLTSLFVTASAWSAPPPSAELRKFFDVEWDWDMSHSPEDATLMGDRRFDDRLSDLSAEAIRAGKSHLVARLEHAQSFLRRPLSDEDRLSLDVFIESTERELAFAQLPLERLAISQQDGPHRSLPTLAQVPDFRDEPALRAYVERLAAMPRYIDQVIQLLDEGRKSGWVAAREPLRDLPASIRAVRAKSERQSVFFQPLLHPAATIPQGAQAALATLAETRIRTLVDPAFERLAAYVEKVYLPAARVDPGVWALPEGAAYYAAAVRLHTTTTRTPAEIHALGLREVSRIRAEMDALMRKTGHKGTRAEFDQMLRTDRRFYHPDGAHLLAGYKEIARRIDAALPRLFARLPKLPYGVIETPALEAPTATTAYYRPGSIEDNRSANFVANTYKPETRPVWEMEALTLHEAVPGHHLQIARAQELTDLPRFRREGMFTAFVEGWALYAESLGPELGMFQDPYAKYGQLTYEMWRAVRLVVDTGMHSMKWTRQQAIGFFVANTAKSQHDIEVEIDRYIVWPGQALAYKVGELEIKRLRAEAQKALGPRFDLKAFHEVVLGAGALPLRLLERRVRAYIRGS